MWENSRFKYLVSNCSGLDSILPELTPLQSDGTPDFSILPENIRYKAMGNGYNLSQATKLDTLEHLREVLVEMNKNGSVAQDFTIRLDAAARENSGFKAQLQAKGLLALGMWDESHSMSTRMWTKKSMDEALSILQQSEGTKEDSTILPSYISTLKRDLTRVFSRPIDEVPTINLTEIHPRFQQVLGIRYEQRSVKEYLEVTPLLPVPRITPQDIDPMCKVLPYLYQSLKMVRNPLTASFFRNFFDTGNHSTSTGTSRGRGRGRGTFPSVSHHDFQNILFPISRLDGIVCLLRTAKWNVRRDLVKKLSNFPLSLPLIMPSVYKRGMRDIHLV